MDDINKFLNDIVSPYWWISVIIVGLFLTIIGNFIYRYHSI